VSNVFYEELNINPSIMTLLAVISII